MLESSLSTYIIFLTLCIFCNSELNLGDQCVISNIPLNGTCIGIRNCKSVLERRISLSFCNPDSKSNFNALVCCDHKSKQKEDPPQRISLQMCRKYYPNLYQPEVYQPDWTISYNSSGENGVNVTNGKKSLGQEFPHMALIGNGDKDDISWFCGGSLISEKFVLTAAHCIYTNRGDPEWVRLGELDIALTMDDADPRDFKVFRIIPHPSYNPPSIYHDIGILQLDGEATFTDFIKPACLPQFNTSSIMFAIVSGWGFTELAGSFNSHLMEATLEIINNTRCRPFFKTTPKEKLSDGIIDDTQICAGGNDGKDTCQGDSGGPLQVRKRGSLEAGVMVYDVIGITSFGMGCGFDNRPGVYTRIAFYLDWIEKTVWPQ